MARQNLLKEISRPLFHLALLNVVYSCTESMIYCVPCNLPTNSVFINQQPKHFNDAYGRLSLMQVNCISLLKLFQMVRGWELSLKPSKDVLQSGSSIEVLLLESYLFVSLKVVVGIEYGGNVLCLLAFLNWLNVLWLLAMTSTFLLIHELLLIVR